MLEIGDIVILKVNCLGNKKGTYGIVYEEYSIGVDHKGVSVFFPNRNPDGFSTEDQKVLFEIMLHHFPNWMIPASFFLNLPFSRLKTFVYESIMRLRSLSIAIDFVNQDFVFLKTGGRIVF